MSITGASTAIYGEYHGTNYYYFGVNKKGELTTLGGLKEKGESNETCAARETKEEGLKVFGSTKKLEKSLKKGKKVKTVVNARCRHITFIFRQKIKGNPVAEFAKKREKGHLKKSEREIKKLKAIACPVVKNLVRNNTNSYQGHKFRSAVWLTLQQAYRENKL